MIDAQTLLTIVLMAGVTYLSRVGGYVVLRNQVLSARATAVMEAAPGCVLISVIAPVFVSKNPADLLALAVTLIAATRFSMLPTVLIGVASAGLLRHIIG
ncbi:MULTISPECIES: AzlD family protein [unclassified Mesorhizobium]|uniref:AzlD family protein n=1 Tax=unclassified Mesorhizobium TaxID=325217 RepID=UPI001129351B|nr:MULTISPECIES: AzlD family protein [unclassified Mesorhizobium]MBZ9810219.1 AzlD family protein [Mesorhizobium sp. ESP-6-2]TPM29469.1 AzlD family protein [Mesorhizobium sp. B2-2-2]